MMLYENKSVWLVFFSENASTFSFVIVNIFKNVFVLSGYLHKCIGALYAIYNPFKQVRAQGIFGCFHQLNFKTIFE